MTTRELMKLINLCEEKHEDYVFIRLYGDGSGGLYSEDDDPELVTWDEDSEIEKTLKEWLKE